MKTPTPLAAATVMLAAVTGPGMVTGWWSWTGAPLSQAPVVITLAHILKLIALAGLLAWCNPSRPTLAVGGLVAGTVATAAAVLVPGIATYALYYATTSIICLVLLAGYLGTAPLWPPQRRDAVPLLVPFPVMLAASVLIAAISGPPEPRLESVTELAAVTSQSQAAIRSVYAGVSEEAAAALLITGLTRARVRLWVVYGVCALTRVAHHPHFGWGSVGLAVVAVGMTALFLRYGRVLPLITAHAGWDLLVSGPYRALTLVPIALGIVVLIVVGVIALWRQTARLLRRRLGTGRQPAEAQPVSAGAAGGEPGRGPGGQTPANPAVDAHQPVSRRP